MGLIVLILHLCKLKSAGVPFLTPVAPKLKGGNKDTLIRMPLVGAPEKAGIFVVAHVGQDVRPAAAERRSEGKAGDWTAVMTKKNSFCAPDIRHEPDAGGCWSSHEVNTLGLTVPSGSIRPRTAIASARS
jgi:hypothetical protein